MLGLNPGPLRPQQALLGAEPSLQPPVNFLKVKIKKKNEQILNGYSGITLNMLKLTVDLECVKRTMWINPQESCTSTALVGR